MPSRMLGMVPLLLALVACSSDGPSGRCLPKDGPKTSLGTRGIDPLGTTAGGGLTEVTSFGANPAGLRMYVHANAKSANAVVLALHGCTQSAADYVSAGWNAFADAAGFVVVYGEQSTKNNGMRCFRYWEPSQAGRDVGEAQSLASMVAHAKATYGAKRAFVTGLSAGGAMTAVMLAVYPDVFEAGAIMAGIPYACATNQTDAFGCMQGKEKSPEAWAALLPAAARAKPPRVSVWHGDADWTVRPTNGSQIAEQWTAAHGLNADKPSATETIGVAKHAVFRDAHGTARVESWSIAGMGHGVAVAPAEGCGTPGGTFFDVKICSTQKAAAFFGLAGGDSGGASSGAGSRGGSDGDDCD
jgi:poly(hydroxyalkanoate) depolymerase family esterase